MNLKNKLKDFFKDYQNVLLAGIFLFALIIRLYYFSKTLNQPLWWDEAEYMNMAKAWAFNLNYNFIPVRPVLLSFITSLFFKISYSEFLPRLMVMILSFFSVVGMYFLGKEFYNKKTGLLSSFFMSVFWLDIFFSTRILVDSISLTFFIFSALFFYRYLKTNSKKSLYIGSVVIAIGVLFRLSTGIFLVCFLVYLLFTQKLSFLKRKELWISGLIFILVLSPYIIWGYFQFNGFVIKQAVEWNSPEHNSLENIYWNFSSYLKNFPLYLSWTLLLVFLAGLVLFYRVFISIDLIIKGKGGSINKEFFLVLLFLFPILLTSSSFDHHIENRYIITAFPSVFIIISRTLLKSYKLLPKQKTLISAGIIILLIFSAHFQLKHADNLIDLKLNSYSGVKKAGIWIKNNLDENAVIFTQSWPQVMYYSDRTTYRINDSEQDFLTTFNETNKNTSYLMLSIYEPSKKWLRDYPRKNNLSLVYVSFLDYQKTKPDLIIYNLSSFG